MDILRHCDEKCMLAEVAKKQSDMTLFSSKIFADAAIAEEKAGV
jgi:hypothetical protein